MKLFFVYIRSKWKVLAVSAFFAVIFTALFLLYGLPLEALVYILSICILFGIAFLIFDFARVRKFHKMFLNIRENIAQISDMPDKTCRIEENDYIGLINLLWQRISDLESDADKKYRDMIEYYTVWAHQIKTPIASMKLILQKEDTSSSRKLRSDLFRIEQYTEMVMTFLRLDSDSSDYVFREHELDTIIRQSVRKFASEFIERKIRLSYEPTGKKLITDDKWLAFVIEQVLSNALKYTKEGSISIFIEGDKLCISDTGIGIADEDIPRIFEKGYTGYNGRSEKSASGIGLYLCRRICNNLGAEISVSSQIGKGTSVYIDLSQYKLKKE